MMRGEKEERDKERESEREGGIRRERVRGREGEMRSRLWHGSISSVNTTEPSNSRLA